MAQTQPTECRSCRHYYVTYEQNRPHGCRHFGFISQRIPSLEVVSASGEACRGFEARSAGASPGSAPGPTRDRGGSGPRR